MVLLFQFLSQRKKQDAEERRNKLKKAREEFTQMLEVCCLLLLEIYSTLSNNIIFLPFLFLSSIDFFDRIVQSWHHPQDGGLCFTKWCQTFNFFFLNKTNVKSYIYHGKFPDSFYLLWGFLNNHSAKQWICLRMMNVLKLLNEIGIAGICLTTTWRSLKTR